MNLTKLSEVFYKIKEALIDRNKIPNGVFIVVTTDDSKIVAYYTADDYTQLNGAVNLYRDDLSEQIRSQLREAQPEVLESSLENSRETSLETDDNRGNISNLTDLYPVASNVIKITPKKPPTIH